MAAVTPKQEFQNAGHDKPDPEAGLEAVRLFDQHFGKQAQATVIIILFGDQSPLKGKFKPSAHLYLIQYVIYRAVGQGDGFFELSDATLAAFHSDLKKQNVSIEPGTIEDLVTACMKKLREDCLQRLVSPPPGPKLNQMQIP